MQRVSHWRWSVPLRVLSLVSASYNLDVEPKSHRTRKDGWSTGLISLLVLAAILACSYVVSIGPAASVVLRTNSQAVHHVYETFYFPMHWAARKSKWADSLLGWYVGLWP